MFIILELQMTDETHLAHIFHTADTYLETESIYHSMLASAAISSIYKHGAVVLTDDGEYVKHQTYMHGGEE